jgi:hypothetical protein
MLHTQTGGETLHVALDRYARWIGAKYVGVDKKPTLWVGTQTRQVAFIRRHLPDYPLSELGAQRVEELIDTLRLRPAAQDGRPVSVSWARSCIKRFRHFLRWLNKTPEFAWKRPADLELTQVRIPLAPQEKSALARSTRVQTYTLDEVRTLWEYATPFQRVLLLLALNCGFGRAEAASLETAEVLLRQKHPHEREVGCDSTTADSWIFRVSHKTGVYAEWKLWPETAAAVAWWLRHRDAISIAAGVTTLLVTHKGQRYDAPTKGNHANFQIPNSWFRLADRIRKDHPAFRRLSFNKLRKTAGNLVRSVAGGEVAAVFLCHGTPVKSDELLDLYTNRPFARVFEAVERVGEQLRPLWAGVAEPFPDSPKKSRANISLGTIRRIQAMARQGYKTGYIAENSGYRRGLCGGGLSGHRTSRTLKAESKGRRRVGEHLEGRHRTLGDLLGTVIRTRRSFHFGPSPPRSPLTACHPCSSRPRRSGFHAGVPSRSKTHLLPAEIGQVLLRGAAPEIDLQVHRREVGRRAAGEERRLLPREIGSVLGASGRRADVDDARVLRAGVLVGDGVTDVGMPPDRVPGLDFRDRDQAGQQLLVPLGADVQGAPELRAAEVVLRDVVLQRAGARRRCRRRAG